MRETGEALRSGSRSLGVKLLIVCALAFAMTIPAYFVGNLVEDRTRRAADVVHELAGYSGGQQTFLGPTLVIPYKISAPSAARRDRYLVFPASASASLKTVTEERRRSLFQVPVYQADLQFDAAFDLSGVPAAAPEGADFDWGRAEIVVGVSDARAALADAVLTANGNSTALVPAETAPDLTLGAENSEHMKLTLLGTRAESFARPDARFNVTASLRFSGAQRVAVLSYGKTTHLTAQGDWPDPGFDGGFLPVRRSVGRHGFTAEWSVPFIARGVRAEGPAGSVGPLEATALGTSFVQVAGPYQSVSRSLKYVLLFVGLVFLSYFVFEVSAGKRVHPAQYVLVGIAQLIFYLLLLCLAERVGFDWAFLLAGTATIALLSANCGWVFASRREAVRGLATFSTLYGLIYLLLRAEDYALLVGAVASFLAIAAAMYLTRYLDWYSPLGTFGTQNSPRDSAVEP